MMLIPAHNRTRRIGPFQYVANMHDGIAAFRSGSSWGYVNELGTVIVEPTYEQVLSFSEGLGIVQETGNPPRYGAVDRTGSLAVPLEFLWLAPFQEGVAGARSQVGAGFIDKTGGWAITPTFHRVGSFSEGLAPVQTQPDGPWGYIDMSGEMVIQPQYRAAEPFSEGRAQVVDDEGQRVFIDRSGTSAVAFESRVGSWSKFRGGIAYVFTWERAGFINRSGDWVWTYPEGDNGPAVDQEAERVSG
jgi:hypothetical protein